MRRFLSLPPRTIPLLRFALVLAAVSSTRLAALQPGDLFPSLTNAGLVGGEQPSSDGKILVVDFWASWCAPCKVSFPALGKLAAEYGARGLVLVGISVDENASAYAAFVKKQAPPFPTLHDARQTLVRVVQVPTMPTTYVMDRQGRVRFIHAGYHGEASDRQLRTEVETLLAEKN